MRGRRKIVRWFYVKFQFETRILQNLVQLYPSAKPGTKALCFIWCESNFQVSYNVIEYVDNKE